MKRFIGFVSDIEPEVLQELIGAHLPAGTKYFCFSIHNLDNEKLLKGLSSVLLEQINA